MPLSPPRLLRSVALRTPPPHGGFPFSVPAVRHLRTLDVDVPVTFFVGENGSGKSTLLEGIAAATRLFAVGSADVEADASLAPARELAATLQLTWHRRTGQGFYLRAEDFFGYLKRYARDEARIAREAGGGGPEGDPGATEHPDELGAAPHLAAVDTRSHGESFLELFRTRLHGGALYLLDEPETPLSPARQLALLALLMDAAADGAQFIIATHSPILLALPGARIYSFDEVPVAPMEYDRLEHVTLTRDFLAAPERYLRHLRGG